MPTLLTIIGSTRPGRAGRPVGEWFHAHAEAHHGFDAQLADLATVDLPLLDEPNHPRLQQYTKDHTRRWSETVASADAIVFVTAEYNYGYPAALKNAIDYLHHEWRHKAVGFVSYGGVAAGTRATQQLKQVVQAIGMYAVQPAVNVPFVQQLLSEDRTHVEANEEMVQAATSLLDELVRIDTALQRLRG